MTTLSNNFCDPPMEIINTLRIPLNNEVEPKSINHLDLGKITTQMERNTTPIRKHSTSR